MLRSKTIFKKNGKVQAVVVRIEGWALGSEAGVRVLPGPAVPCSSLPISLWSICLKTQNLLLTRGCGQ